VSPVGIGQWPETDAWGEPFTDEHPAHWKAKAGAPLCGAFRGALDGFCGDLAYLHKVFGFKRNLTAQLISMAIRQILVATTVSMHS